MTYGTYVQSQNDQCWMLPRAAQQLDPGACMALTYLESFSTRELKHLWCDEVAAIQHSLRTYTCVRAWGLEVVIEPPRYRSLQKGKKCTYRLHGCSISTNRPPCTPPCSVALQAAVLAGHALLRLYRSIPQNARNAHAALRCTLDTRRVNYDGSDRTHDKCASSSGTMLEAGIIVPRVPRVHQHLTSYKP